MYKRWIVKFQDDREEQEFCFGEVVYTGHAWWFTVHHTQKGHRNYHCDICAKPILPGQIYVRFHTPRDPDNLVACVDRRHLSCRMPSDIEYIRIEEIERG